MGRAALVAATLVLAGVSAQSHAWATGYELEQDCLRPAENGGRDAVEQGYCLGYISAAMELVPCTPPPQTQIGVAQRVFLNWARRNPQRLSEPTAAAVNDSFREAWVAGVDCSRNRRLNLSPKSPQRYELQSSLSYARDVLDLWCGRR
jgi:hypothetical protein